MYTHINTYIYIYNIYIYIIYIYIIYIYIYMYTHIIYIYIYDITYIYIYMYIPARGTVGPHGLHHHAGKHLLKFGFVRRAMIYDFIGQL